MCDITVPYPHRTPSRSCVTIISASSMVLAFSCPFTTLWTALVITAVQAEGGGRGASVEGKNHCGWIQLGISSNSLWNTVTLQSFLYGFVSNKCDGLIKMRRLLPTGLVWHKQQNKIWKVRKMTFFCTSVWKRLGSSSTMPGKLHVQSHIYAVLASLDHLLLCLMCRFTAAGVHSAAHLSGLTMEDYPNLGISSMEDRTRLFRLVQTIKYLDLCCDESECNSSDSEENHRVVDDGLSLCSGLGHDGDERRLSGVGRRLDFSGKALGHQQKLSCNPARLHVSSTHNRRAEAGGAPCVQFVNDHDPRDRDSVTDTHRNPTCGSHRPPHILSQLSSRRVWRKEREGISKKETHRLKALEQKAVTVPVYESRTAGYNYGLPLSSPPAPNKRWVWCERVNSPRFHHLKYVHYESNGKMPPSFGPDHKIMHKNDCKHPTQFPCYSPN